MLDFYCKLLSRFLMYGVMKNGFRKVSILGKNFTTEDGICYSETSFV